MSPSFLIAFIIFIIIMANISAKKKQKKAAEKAERAAQQNLYQRQPQQVQQNPYQRPQQQVQQNPYQVPQQQSQQYRYAQPQQQNPYAQTQQRRQMTEEDRRKLEAYRQKKMAQQSGMAQSQIPDIVARAKNNADNYAQDVTLQQLEEEHQHSERMSAGEHMADTPRHPQDAAHVSKHVEEQDAQLLGTVEDLMVKGYDGKLSFERDFLGEAMDMINSFSIPDYKEEM